MTVIMKPRSQSTAVKASRPMDWLITLQRCVSESQSKLVVPNMKLAKTPSQKILFHPSAISQWNK
jgi:hypothetical protein